MPDFGRWTGNGGDPSLNEINRDERFLDALAIEPAGVRHRSRVRRSWRSCSRTGATRSATPRSRRSSRSATRPSRCAGAVGEVSRKRHPDVADPGRIGRRGACCASAGSVPRCTAQAPVTRSTACGPCSSARRRARDDQVALASQQLAQVQQLIDQGDWQQAQDKLVDAVHHGAERRQVERQAGTGPAVECVDLQGGRAGSRRDAAAARSAATGVAVVAADPAAGPGDRDHHHVDVALRTRRRRNRRRPRTRRTRPRRHVGDHAVDLDSRRRRT